MVKIEGNILADIAKSAGEIILSHYHKEDLSIETKSDESPVTIADKESNDYICSELQKRYPDIPIISEENTIAEFEQRKNWSGYFLIDPLDGTKEFIKKNGDFTVNIAYGEGDKIIEGAVYIPTEAITFYTQAGESFQESHGEILKLPLKLELDRPILVTSRSHKANKETDAFLANLKPKFENIKIEYIGSSLKICRLAQGLADVYPRFNPTMEWDTAAAQVILEQAGGQIVQFKNFGPLKYNKEDLHNPKFLALSSRFQLSDFSRVD